MMKDKLGKIDQYLIKGMVGKYVGRKRPEVRVGPMFGVDVSVIDLPGGMALAATSDPLSLIPSLGLQESAWLSVQLMANDMATTGFPPQYGQFVLNLPASFSTQDFETYWQYIHTFCDRIGIAITGGHTGFVEGQHSTIAGGGTLFMVAPRQHILTSQNAAAGDLILATKQAAISSTAILAMSFKETVIKKLGTETYHAACGLFYETSSLKDALTAVGDTWDKMAVSAMHDVTEGGILGAIYELVTASGKGAVVYNNDIPVGKIQQAVCGLFSIEPRYSVGAGSMIITCKKNAVGQVKNRLAREQVSCSVVGEIKEKAYGIKLVENDMETDLIYQQEDPYWAAFYNAIKNGWK